jgi:hypothetical protein
MTAQHQRGSGISTVHVQSSSRHRLFKTTAQDERLQIRRA